MELIVVSTGAVCSDISEVEVEMREGITCSEVLHQLEKELVGADLKGKALPWHLEEEWKGCSKEITMGILNKGHIGTSHYCPIYIGKGGSGSQASWVLARPLLIKPIPI